MLPYCLLNCGIMALVEWLSLKGIRIAFPVQAHALMTLLVSFLALSKMNLCYERYMRARFAISDALQGLRELHQLAFCFTFQPAPSEPRLANDAVSKTVRQQQDQPSDTKNLQQLRQWQLDLTERIVDLIDATLDVIRHEDQALYLARNEHSTTGWGGDDDIDDNGSDSDSSALVDAINDPYLHVQALRMHLFNEEHGLPPMERLKLLDLLHDFCVAYRQLLVLASTPLPFALVQMARTFLLLWTFTIPFVLRGVVDEAAVAMLFVFFLTYGFVGLELVSLKLVHPFGDGTSDLNVTGMREATVRAVRRDVAWMYQNDPDAMSFFAGFRRRNYSRSKKQHNETKGLTRGVGTRTALSAIDPVHDNRGHRKDDGSGAYDGYGPPDGSHPPTDQTYMAMHA